MWSDVGEGRFGPVDANAASRPASSSGHVCVRTGKRSWSTSRADANRWNQHSAESSVRKCGEPVNQTGTFREPRILLRFRSPSGCVQSYTSTSLNVDSCGAGCFGLRTRFPAGPAGRIAGPTGRHAANGDALSELALGWPIGNRPPVGNRPHMRRAKKQHWSRTNRAESPRARSGVLEACACSTNPPPDILDGV
jgi:hypothetical protein